MKFLSLLVALTLEQLWPLRQGNPVHVGFARYLAFLEIQLNSGQYRHGAIAWALATVPAAVVAVAAYHVFYSVSPVTAWMWNLAVLYLTMGFRQFSHAYTEIQKSLQVDDLASARDRLGRWRGESAAEFSAGEVARVAIEQGLLASHRHVFGTLAWFVALGPAGAVLYRAAAVLAHTWGARTEPEFGDFGRFAVRVFYWIDWLPTRATAWSFAIVGDFADAYYCWRVQAAAWATESHGIILAAGGGALGVRLGDTLHQHGGLQYRPELGLGDDADAGHMDQAVGLVWRSLVLWMFLILLVSLAHALG